MTLIESLYAQGIRAFREPRAAAADIMALGVPREVVVPALFLVGILSVLIDTALFAAIPELGLERSPFRSLVFYVVIAAFFAFVVTFVGKWFQGVGTLDNALLLVVFLQAMLLPASIIQLGLALVSPNMAVMFIFVVALFLIWVQINFVAALHGFSSLWRAAAVTVLSSFIVAFVAAPFIAAPELSVSDV